MNKKHLIILQLFLSVNFCFSQWVEKEFIDEFDEPTGEKYQFMISEGVFSDIRNTNSKLKGEIVKTKNEIQIYLYWHKTQLAKNNDYRYCDVKLKNPKGEIIDLIDALFSTDGFLEFKDENYRVLSQNLTIKGTHIMVFTKKTDLAIDEKYKLYIKIE